MIASRVAKESEVRALLRERGFQPTQEKTKTGTFWRHTATGKHLLVPFSVQGFYPDWLLHDLHEQIKRVSTVS